MLLLMLVEMLTLLDKLMTLLSPMLDANMFRLGTPDVQSSATSPPLDACS
jgi:hypothetical protein